MHTSLRDVWLLETSVRIAQEKEEVGNQLRFECPTLWKAIVPGSVGSLCQTWMDRRCLPAYRPYGVLWGLRTVKQCNPTVRHDGKYLENRLLYVFTLLPIHLFKYKVRLNSDLADPRFVISGDLWYYPLHGQGITHFTAPTPFTSMAPCQPVLCYKTPMADTWHCLTLNSVPVIPS